MTIEISTRSLVGSCGYTNMWSDAVNAAAAAKSLGNIEKRLRCRLRCQSVRCVQANQMQSYIAMQKCTSSSQVHRTPRCACRTANRECHSLTLCASTLRSLRPTQWNSVCARLLSVCVCHMSSTTSATTSQCICWVTLSAGILLNFQHSRRSSPRVT